MQYPPPQQPYDPQYQQYPQYQPPKQQGPFGLDPNVAGLISYAPCAIGLVGSIVFFVVEKNNRFVRFHALQSLLMHGVFFVLGIGLNILFVILGNLGTLGAILALLGSLLSLGLGLVILGIQIFMMIKAYGNQTTKLPVIGDLAEKNS